MQIVVPPRLTSLLNERNTLAPTARGALYWAGKVPKVESSDGTVGDAAHRAQGDKSDHNPDQNGVVHAVDISQSMPGAPWWDERCGKFDVFALFRAIIADFNKLGPADRVKRYGWLKYLVWNEGGREVIWSPDRASEGVRRNGTKTGHKEHGHISINHDARSENDTQPIFTRFVKLGDEDEMSPEEKKELKDFIETTAHTWADRTVDAVRKYVDMEFNKHFPKS